MLALLDILPFDGIIPLRFSTETRIHIWSGGRNLNELLFNLFAFWGTCDWSTILSIFVSGYLIFIFTSLLDTPFAYLARRISDRRKKALADGQKV